MAGDGYEHLTAWAGAGNAVLFFDAAGQGALTRADQVVFTDLDPSAKTDMQALLDVFDTNHDGKLDAGDASFADFFLHVTNANGTTSVETLAQAAVASINLVPSAVEQALPDGSSIDGETTYTTTGGATGLATTRLGFCHQGIDVPGERPAGEGLDHASSGWSNREPYKESADSKRVSLKPQGATNYSGSLRANHKNVTTKTILFL